MQKQTTSAVGGLLLIAVTAGTLLPGCGVPAYRQSITAFSEASASALEGAEQYIRSVSTNERKNILYEKIDALHDSYGGSGPPVELRLAELETGQGGILNAEMFIVRIEAIKIVRAYIAAIGALAASDSGTIAGGAIQDIGGAVTRIRIVSASASTSNAQLDAFAKHSAIISNAVAYLTEKAFGLAVEKTLDKAIVSAAPAVNGILELLTQEIGDSHQVARELAGASLTVWLAEFNLEAERLRSNNGAVGDLETLARLADNIVSAIEARDALRRDDPTKTLGKLKDAHDALATLAKSKKSRVDLDNFEEELDHFLARARSMSEALKAYREAIANRPDATLSEMQKLFQTTVDMLIGRLKEVAGVPDLKYP